LAILGLSLVDAGCSPALAEAARATTLYQCAGERSFTVARDDRTAVIVYSGVRYELPRRKSSIGERYATSGATLIIDGKMAAFVTGSVMNLDVCRAAERVRGT
jgi:membrane-bound inhibitor of C-type lysozyme